MDFNNYTLTVKLRDEEKIIFEVADNLQKTPVIYYIQNENITFINRSLLSEVLVKNQFQFDKIIKSAAKGNLLPGQQIDFVFIEKFTFLNNNDYNHFIRIDNRNNNLSIGVSKEGTNSIHKMYTDGSYAGDINHSGYAGIVEDERGNREIFFASFPNGSNNLMELLAVVEGLKRLQHVEKIQINTDSRFVIRGLSQWIHFWKLNNWQMAYGRKIRYEEHWQLLDLLCRGKFLELKWIKAHSGDINHTLCHQLAKQIATRSNLISIDQTGIPQNDCYDSAIYTAK